MEEIPSTVFRKGPTYDIVSALLMKTKLTLETSVLRTLFYTFDQEKVEETSRFNLDRGINVFSLGMPKEDNDKQKMAILALNSIIKGYIKSSVLKFEANKKQSMAIRRYFSKFIANYELLKKISFDRIKSLPIQK